MQLYCTETWKNVSICLFMDYQNMLRDSHVVVLKSWTESGISSNTTEQTMIKMHEKIFYLASYWSKPKWHFFEECFNCSMNVNVVQSNIVPQWVSLYGEKKNLLGITWGWVKDNSSHIWVIYPFKVWNIIETWGCVLTSASKQTLCNLLTTS